MTAKELFESHELAVQYIYGKLDNGLHDEITQLVSIDAEVENLINDITYISIMLNLDYYSLLVVLNDTKRTILSKTPKI